MRPGGRRLHLLARSRFCPTEWVTRCRGLLPMLPEMSYHQTPCLPGLAPPAHRLPGSRHDHPNDHPQPRGPFLVYSGRS